MFPSLEFTLIKDIAIESALLGNKIKALSGPLFRLAGETTRFRHMGHQYVGNEAIR